MTPILSDRLKILPLRARAPGHQFIDRFPGILSLVENLINFFGNGHLHPSFPG